MTDLNRIVWVRDRGGRLFRLNLDTVAMVFFGKWNTLYDSRGAVIELGDSPYAYINPAEGSSGVWVDVRPGGPNVRKLVNLDLVSAVRFGPPPFDCVVFGTNARNALGEPYAEEIPTVESYIDNEEWVQVAPRNREVAATVRLAGIEVIRPLQQGYELFGPDRTAPLGIVTDSDELRRLDDFLTNARVIPGDRP